MYCKKCGKDYKKGKKVCSDCGIALTPGTSPGKRGKNSNKTFIIVGIIIFAVIIAFFLIVGLGGTPPAQ